MTRRRALWQVVPRPGVFRWALICDGEVQRTFLTQAGAIAEGRASCRYNWAEWCARGELQCHDREGRILWKDTYGDDPVQVLG